MPFRAKPRSRGVGKTRTAHHSVRDVYLDLRRLDGRHLPPPLSWSAARQATRGVRALSAVSDRRDRQRLLRPTFRRRVGRLCAGVAARLSLRQQGLGSHHRQATRPGSAATRSRRDAQSRLPERHAVQGRRAWSIQPRVPRSRRSVRVRIPGDARQGSPRSAALGRSAGRFSRSTAGRLSLRGRATESRAHDRSAWRGIEAQSRRARVQLLDGDAVDR